MLPFRDSEPRSGTPVVTWLVIAFTALVYLYECTLEPAALEVLIERSGLVPKRALVDPWAFVTSLFLHGSLLHLVSNLWALWIFGDNVEDHLGSLRFLAFYVLAGVAAGAVHSATTLHSATPTIGASGAIAGVMGAYFVLYPRAEVVALVPVLCFPLFLRLPAVVYLGLWFVLQVLGGAGAQGSPSGGIAWWAHVGGFLSGIVLLGALGPPRGHASQRD